MYAMFFFFLLNIRHMMIEFTLKTENRDVEPACHRQDKSLLKSLPRGGLNGRKT